MSKTVISVENLTKRYDLGVIGTGTLSRDLNRWWARLRGQPDPYTRIGQEDSFNRRNESILALDDVSFTVQQGEALGIIGKNGAGKSTLLKILSRVTAPTSGVVKVRGRIGSLLEVGTGFHRELTGRENIFLNGAILGMRKDEVERKFDEIVDFSGVEKFIDTPVKRYSSGMYVRLGFAVAAHLDPEILIVDEVLAVGDADFQKKCVGKMSEVAEEGRTILFVSHNMLFIKKICEKGILLSNGSILYEGGVDNCIDKYLNVRPIKSNRIIDHINYLDNIIKIHNISINGYETDEYHLDEGINTLTIQITGYLSKPIPLDIEVRIKDFFGNPLALFSPGHIRGYANTIDSGDFQLEWEIKFPERLTKGEYYLDIDLTNPFKKYWVRISNSVRVYIHGIKTPAGRVIEYKDGNGWQIL